MLLKEFGSQINGHVNYPLKNILIKLEEEGVIDMDSPLDRYCVSRFTLHVANAGATQAVSRLGMSTVFLVSSAYSKCKHTSCMYYIQGAA